jgi:hypothetical protein
LRRWSAILQKARTSSAEEARVMSGLTLKPACFSHISASHCVSTPAARGSAIW